MTCLWLRLSASELSSQGIPAGLVMGVDLILSGAVFWSPISVMVGNGSKSGQLRTYLSGASQEQTQASIVCHRQTCLKPSGDVLAL